MGNVTLLDSITGAIEYLVKGNNPRIINSNVFNRVHVEKKRSNVIKEDGRTVQKDKKYSSKTKR